MVKYYCVFFGGDYLVMFLLLCVVCVKYGEVLVCVYFDVYCDIWIDYFGEFLGYGIWIYEVI